jgi:2-hydroxy-6-oxonona-2,4-dienedioate hydrolase
MAQGRAGRRVLQATLLIALLVLLAAALWTALAFRRDMQAAYARIEGRSQLLQTPLGDIEWRDGGQGPPVLVVHGSGGGFDQGELLARTLLPPGWRWIAPSRCGYLRSTCRPGATFDDQAHAYVALLDHLKIDRVAVVALSHGGPSALLLAALHPDRVASLTLVSGGVAADTSRDHRQADRQGRALMQIYQHDLLYWTLTHALRRTFLQLMGVNDAVIDSLTPAQRALADAVIDGMNPVSPRAAGTRFDHDAAMPDHRIAAIRAPTLVLHARDDSLQPFANAEFAARHVPGARLQAFDRGGHLLLAVELAAVRQALQQHLAAHAAP